MAKKGKKSSKGKSTSGKGSTTKKSSPSVKRSSGVSVKKSASVSKPKSSIKKAPTQLGKKTVAKTTLKKTAYTGALSAKTIKAQQALSNKYGIATFNTRGKVSTVPTASSGGFSNISVGLGAYENFDNFANEAIRVAIDNEKTARQQGEGITVSQDGAIIPSTNANDPFFVADPRNPTRFLDEKASAQAGEPILTNQKSDFGLSGVNSFLAEHGVKIGIGLAAFLIIMAVIKKK